MSTFLGYIIKYAPHFYLLTSLFNNEWGVFVQHICTKGQIKKKNKVIYFIKHPSK